MIAVGGNGAAATGGQHFSGALERQAQTDHHIGHAGDGKQHRHAAVEAGFEDIGGGDGAETSHDRGDEPVEGGDGQVEPLIPDARQAAGETFGGDADGLIGMGAGAEGEHHHHGLAELAGHEEVAALANLPGFEPADDNQHDHIGGQDSTGL